MKSWSLSLADQTVSKEMDVFPNTSIWIPSGRIFWCSNRPTSPYRQSRAQLSACLSPFSAGRGFKKPSPVLCLATPVYLQHKNSSLRPVHNPKTMNNNWNKNRNEDRIKNVCHVVLHSCHTLEGNDSEQYVENMSYFLYDPHNLEPWLWY